MRHPTRIPAFLVALATLGASVACSPSVETVLEKNLEAMGGRAAIAAVQSLHFTGTQTIGGAKVKVDCWWRKPDRIRFDFDSLGLVGSQAYADGDGWAMMPFTGDFVPHRLEGEALADLAERADLMEGPTFGLAARGAKARLLGREAFDGHDAWKVELENARGVRSTHFYDAGTWLELGIVRTQKGVDGRETEITTVISDYRRVGDVLFSHRTEDRAGEAVVGSFVVESIELGVETPDDLWRMPPPPAGIDPATGLPL